MVKQRSIGVALLGFGTVGQGVYDILAKHKSYFARKLAVPIEVKKILVRDLKKKREVATVKTVFAKTIEEIVNDPSIDIVVELMGGLHPAKDWIVLALQAGKDVVSANKAVLAVYGKEILGAAEAASRSILFDAAVAGGIPLIRAIREGLSGNRMTAFYGIVNGTANYILTEMDKHKVEFGDALKKAQALGYAEQDPSMDVEGIDAAHKLVILIHVCFGLTLRLEEIPTQGIQRIDALDLQFAEGFGYAVRLLAIAKRDSDGRLSSRVEPTLIPKASILAKVDGAYNAAFVHGDSVGDLMFYGPGAGRYPAASSAVSDILELAERIGRGDRGYVSPYGFLNDKLEPAKPKPMAERESEYYLRFSVLDRPHVLETISKILAKHGVSIATVYQPAPHGERSVPIAMVTHKALEKNLVLALKEIDSCDFLVKKSGRIPIENL